MPVEITEGLLFDLISKRRATKFTADELLWAADNMEKIREFLEQEKRDPALVAKRLKYLVEHPKIIDRLIDGNLVTIESSLLYDIVTGKVVFPTSPGPISMEDLLVMLHAIGRPVEHRISRSWSAGQEDWLARLQDVKNTARMEREAVIGKPVEQKPATPAQPQTAVSDWQKFFGHLRVSDPNFNEANFPLGVDPGDEAEEFGFPEVIFVEHAIIEFQKMGREEASLWAQGRYIQSHLDAQMEYGLFGTCARWQGWSNRVWFPVFFANNKGLNVDLCSFGRTVLPRHRFLLRRKDKK